MKQKSSTAKSLSVVTEEVKGQGSSNNPKEDDSTTGVGVSSGIVITVILHFSLSNPRM